MDADSIVRRTDGHVSADLDDELVLLNLDCGKYFGFDVIARDIWGRLAQAVRVADLCAALAQEYDADTATILADVLPLLERMEQERLLAVQPAR